MTNNKFYYNFGKNGGPLYIESPPLTNISIVNTVLENNAAILSKGCFSIMFSDVSKSKIEIQNTTFVNCYSSDHGCLDAKTNDYTLNQVLEIDNMTFTFTKPNWKTNYENYYTEEGKIWTDEFPQHTADIYPKCFGYSTDYFYFEEVPTKITNFVFSNTNLELNSACISDLTEYPKIVTYSKINKGSFGKADLTLQDLGEIDPDGSINIFSMISDVPGNLPADCSYDQIYAQSNYNIYIYIYIYI